MAAYQWEKITENGWFREIEHLYGKDFPIEVRSILSNWLSTNDRFMNFDINEPAHHDEIFAFVGALNYQLSQFIESHPTHDEANFYHKKRLRKYFKRIQSQESLQLFQKVKESLSLEKQRIDQLTRSSPNSTPSTSVSSAPSFAQIREQIDNALVTISERCSTLEQKTPTLANTSANIRYNMYHLQQQASGNGQNGNYSYNITPEEVQQQRDLFLLEMQSLHASFEEVIGFLKAVHGKCMDELEKWNDDQRLVVLGKSPDRDFETIEKWFLTLSKCNEGIKTQLLTYKDICVAWNYSQEHLQVLQEDIKQIDAMREKMIEECLVVTKQPKQVIRSSTNFGPIHLKILPFSTNMMISDVEAGFMSEKTVQDYLKNPNHACSKLPPKYGDFKHEKVGNKIEFKSVTVSKVSKSSKRGEQFAVEERFWIYFRVAVTCQGETIMLWTTSLPVSVTSHPVQDSKAWTYVLWYNASPIKSRPMFDVPDHIPWSQLIEAINIRFISLGRGLTEQQKGYLRDKLFRGNIPTNEMVQRDQFCTKMFSQGKTDPDDGKSEKNYSFGEWINCCVKILQWVPKNTKLAHHGLRRSWADGNVIGFIAKDNLQDLLKDCAPGTFMIRFPENVPDTIGLYFYNIGARSTKKVLTPLYTTKDFNIKSLPERIIDSKAATYLYPNIKKELAFGAFSRADTAVTNGYFFPSIQEYFPSSILRSLKPSLVDGFSYSPSSSHSVHSYATSPSYSESGTPDPRVPEVRVYSPGHYNNATSTTEDFLISSGMDGIDPRVIVDDDD